MKYPSMLYRPAMEADDITKEVDTMTSKVSGESDKNADIDTSNTDDIFGTKKKSGVTKQKKGKEEETPDTAEEEPSENEDPTTDEDTPDKENTDDVNNIDGDNELDDAEAEENPDEDDGISDEEKMAKIKKKLMLLYNVFNSAINTIDTASNDVNDSELTKAYSRSKEYLTYGKNHIFEIITERLKKDEYPIILKKYIGLCRFYDICVSMIDKSMQKYEDSLNKKIFTRKKRKSEK